MSDQEVIVDVMLILMVVLFAISLMLYLMLISEYNRMLGYDAPTDYDRAIERGLFCCLVIATVIALVLHKRLIECCNIIFVNNKKIIGLGLIGCTGITILVYLSFLLYP